MNERLKLIREKCIAANPEMEKRVLVEGWQLSPLVKDALSSVFNARFNKNLDYDQWAGIRDYLDTCAGKIAEKVNDQHRPIRLADVLLAVPHLKPRDHRNIVRGQSESAGNVGFMNIICEWNLRAADLEQQSEETINFLYDLLT